MRLRLKATTAPGLAKTYSVQPSDLVVLMRYNYPEFLNQFYYRGQLTNHPFADSHFYHGSSNTFDAFEGNNHFFTLDLLNAMSFADLSHYFRGGETCVSYLYICDLDKSNVYEPTQEDRLCGIGNDPSPSDGACQAFMASNPQYTCLRFSSDSIPEFDDFGVSEVWFTDKPSAIKILKRVRVFTVQVPDGYELPSSQPTTLFRKNKYELYMESV